MKAVKILSLFTTALVVTDFAFAQTWTQATNVLSAPWNGVASSADGTRLVAVSGGIYISTNSGATWTLNSTPTGTHQYQWQGIASSADGMKLVAVDANFGGIYTSTNFGQTWISNNVPNNYWWSVASSADGTNLVAAVGIGGGPIYNSTNSGETWNMTSAPSTDYWSSVTSSADGTKLAAVQMSDASFPIVTGGYIYTSTNSGNTWNQTGAPFKAWEAIASSADGIKLIAAGSGIYNGTSSFDTANGIYTSTNSGATWILTGAPTNVPWSSVASSTDGIKLAAGTGNGSIYISTDSGTTWILNTNLGPNETISSVASSADGNKMVLVINYGGIWNSQTMPSPSMNIAPASSNFVLSWIIPSTNFMLQQSADLISWAGVTNTPMLNFTNLQNQVTLAPSNRSGFYRLKTP